MQFLNYFDRVVVINLPERTDRRKGVEAELRRLGLGAHARPVEFFAAIRPEHAASFSSRGVRGCFESHLAVLRQARADGLSNVLILEDDFACTPELERLQSRLLGQLARSSWDVVSFGHDLPASDAEPRLMPPPARYTLAHCYAVNGRCFDALIAFLELVHSRPAGHPDGGAMHYDGALDTFRTQQKERAFLVAYPSVAGQRSSRSDITPSRLDAIPVLRAALALTRAGVGLARQSMRGLRKQAKTVVAGQSVRPSVFPPQ